MKKDFKNVLGYHPKFERGWEGGGIHFKGCLQQSTRRVETGFKDCCIGKTLCLDVNNINT
jgi:hypothetical protein